MKRTDVLIAFAGLLLVGCNAPAYYPGFEKLVIDQGAIDAAEADEEGGHPEFAAFLQTEYYLDYEAPTPLELEQLQPPGADPVDVIPWVQRGDLEFSIQWRLENLSGEAIEAWVTLDGATEFYDWNPIALYGAGGGEDAEELAYPSLLGYYPRHLEPNQVMTGEFREDDTIEAAYDLDVLTRFCGGPFAVLNNRSEVDARGTEGVPPGAVIAGFYMVRLTLGADGPASLDYSIRIRDRDGVLYDATTDDFRYEAIPEPYVPAGLAAVAVDPAVMGTESAYCAAMQDMGDTGG